MCLETLVFREAPEPVGLKATCLELLTTLTPDMEVRLC